MKELVNIMNLFYDNFVVNWHEHVCEKSPGVLDELQCEKLISCSEQAGFDRLLCSIPVTDDPYCPPEVFRRVNDVVYKAMKRHPGKILGMCFVNPGCGIESIAEIERCIKELGMVGVKLYHQYFIDDPVQYKLIEKCIDLDVPLLMHAGKACDQETQKRQPRLSNGIQFANIAKRYPEASIIMAHIGGGGDWQWSLKAIEKSPNIMIDIGGSIYDYQIIEESVAHLGANRILFGTDGSFSSCIGKMLGASITDDEKRTILEGTAFLRFLEREGGR